jgi:hypothetical protein
MRPPGRRESSWQVVVPTRGDPDALRRIAQNIANRLPGTSITVILNRPHAPNEAGGGRHLLGADVEVRECLGDGVSRARNHGLEIAEQPVVVFLDDDVVASRGAIEMLAESMRTHAAAVATARVVPAPPADICNDWLTFDRGPATRIWKLAKGRRTQPSILSPFQAWDLGAGAAFAVNRDRMREVPTPPMFDERLSNGRFCGGSEDVDFFYRTYLSGLTVVYAATAVVHHHFPSSARTATERCRQYALADGTFYAKWIRHARPSDLWRELVGWLARIAESATRRGCGKSAVPLTTLLAEPPCKLLGGLHWALVGRRR